jgi:hypothetical protein
MFIWEVAHFILKYLFLIYYFLWFELLLSNLIWIKSQLYALWKEHESSTKWYNIVKENIKG